MADQRRVSSVRPWAGFGVGVLAIGAVVAATVWAPHREAPRPARVSAPRTPVAAHRASRGADARTASRALRSDYGAHAAEVLNRATTIERTRAGYALVRNDLTHAPNFAAVVPRDASEAIAFEVDGRERLTFREIGARGSTESTDGALSYARDGGRSYWTKSDRGYEEWLDIESGRALAGRELARWAVEGATLEKRDDIVLVRDRERNVRMLVSAPRAWARSGREVQATLRVERGAIVLEVDANGEAVLVDPAFEPPTPCVDDSECNSGDACHVDYCDLDEFCYWEPLPVDDGNECTFDSCDSMTGAVNTPLDPVDYDDTDPCTLDTCDPLVGPVYTPVGPEDDGNACTTDYCMEFVGQQHELINYDDGNPCTDDTCDALAGPAHTPVPIDDFDACTADSCDSGTGTVSHVPVPVDDGEPCTVDSCDPGAGVVHTPLDPDDGNVCTTDSCIPGLGPVHVPVNVDDMNACTTDACHPFFGPVHTPVPFDDGNACTADSCDPLFGVANTPIPLDDNDTCTVDACDPGVGVIHTPLDVSDGNACTTDICVSGYPPVHVPIFPDDSNRCTTDTCDPILGPIYTPVVIDDGNVCTTDSCDPLVGLVHALVSTDDTDACTDDWCDPFIGVMHAPTNIDDGDACTSDACDPGAGQTHAPVNVDDGNSCTIDACDPSTGPSHATAPGCNVTVICDAPNTTIPDSGMGTASDVTGPVGGIVVDVDVTVFASHTWVGDVTWTLTHGATSALLVDRVGHPALGSFGCNSDDFAMTLDDEATAGPVEDQCSLTPPAVSGVFTPATPLASFDTSATDGTWSLLPNDLIGGDQGVFEQWCITITWRDRADPNGTPCLSPADCASSFCADGVCCDVACSGYEGDCQACSIGAGATSDGICGPTTGNQCSDGNSCTTGDSCQAGVCTGAPD